MNCVLSKLRKIILYLLAILSVLGLSVPTTIFGLKNKVFDTLTIDNTLATKNLIVSQDLVIGGNVALVGAISSPSLLNTQGVSVPNEVAIFADNTGNLIKSSGVKIDSAGNIEINGITKNGITVSWPSTIGASLNYLANDGAGNLYYTSGGGVGGGGNVRTNAVFTADNRLVVTDTLISDTNIKQSGVTLDASDNITGVNNFSANNITATLVGNAATADQTPSFTGVLMGQVSGGQSSTQVDFIGTKPAATIAANTVAGNLSTSLNNANTIVARDALGSFLATTITANLFHGNVTGNLTGQANSATTSTNTNYFLQPLQGDVIGTQTATIVSQVGSKSAASIANATSVIATATNANISGEIVKRDASRNFAANEITSNLTGNVTGNVYGQAGTAINASLAQDFTGPLIGDVIGNQGTTQIISVGSQTASYIAAGVDIANTSTSSSISGAVVMRDALGNFSANKITADLLGSVTGSLYGTATTATIAASGNFANTASDFTGILLGDVTGSQGATVVYRVGTKLATDVSAAVDLVQSATSEDVISTIVKRDFIGSFTINKIILNGSPVNIHDATTKSYVDTAVTQGLVLKTPARVLGSSNVSPLSGAQTIDGIAVVTGNRVLLIGQSNQVENGLWVANTSSSWTRPTDFLAGTQAQRAYVAIDEGLAGAGSSWLCTTPLSIIGLNDINFAQFSVADQTTAANVGAGQGQIFRDKIGAIINLKSLQGSDHIIIDNFTDTVSIKPYASSESTPYSIATRDLGGLVTATNMFGAASLNLLKSGGQMTGNLSMASDYRVNLFDSSGLSYLGVKAPLAVISTYTIDLPTQAPVAGQFLQASSPSTTTWASIGGSPSAGKNYYVSLSGSDSNDGSIYSPYRTVKHAVLQASPIASLVNPVAIIISAGTFEEDNSVGATPSGPIAINNNGISIVGSSITGTIIKPMDLTNNLFTTTVSNLSFSNITLQKNISGSSASAIRFDSYETGKVNFNSVAVNGFDIGLDFNWVSGDYPKVLLQDFQCEQNIKAIRTNNMPLNIKNSMIKGAQSLPAANVGIEMTGLGAAVEVFDTDFMLSESGVLASNQAYLYFFGCSIDSTKYGMAFSGASRGNILGSTFSKNETSDSINISSKDLYTLVYLNGCLLDCANSAGTATGTGVKVFGYGQVYFCNSTIEKAAVAVDCGTSSDDNNTVFVSSFLNLMYCPIDIRQRGTSAVLFVGGAIETETLDIENPTYVSCSAFNSNGETTLSFGNTFDMPQKIFEAENGQTEPPFLGYQSGNPGKKGIFYHDLNANSAFYGLYSKIGSAAYYNLTGDRSKNSKALFMTESDGLNVGTNICGWEVSRVGSQADLAFTYTRNYLEDPRGQNVVMNLNGLANNIEFPEAIDLPLPTNSTAKLVWGSDTNLYRVGSGILKTDGNIIVGDLSPNFALYADANSKLVSSVISTTTLGYLSGVSSPIQTQLDNKVAKSGGVDGIMSGNLVLPAGSASSPSLQFTGSLNTGMSAISSNTLVFSTAGVERMRISDDGSVYINQFSVPGVLHNDSLGRITSSLVTNSDIDASAAIVDTKLAQIVSAGKVTDYATTATAINVAGAIVQRDMLGSFTTTTVVAANLYGNASSADSFTGNLYGDVTGTQLATVVSSIGSGLKSAVTISAAMDVLASATSNNVAGKIVKRDSSGNFAANIITILAATTNTTDVATKSYVDQAITNYANNQVELLHRFNVVTNGVNNITTDGLYTLTCNITGSIVITADNVTIDMYGFTLNSTTNPVVQIGSGGVARQNIEIKNGKIRDATGLTNNGILVGANCSLLRFSNLEIYSCLSGISFNGSAGSINRGKLENCSFYSCNKGVYLNYANKIVFKNCKASSCVEKGFDQQACNFNVFDKCSALETINNSVSTDATGFASIYGRGSLFNGCVAEGTTKSSGTYTTDSTRAIGFLLTGTEGAMENETKIINSVANTSLVNTSSCSSYGILIDPVLKAGTFVTLLVSNITVAGSKYIQAGKWSPDGKYIATGGQPSDVSSPYFGDGKTIRVFKLSGTSVSQVASVGTVYSNGIDWSPDGKYLISCGTASPTIIVYRFDGSSLTQVATSITGSYLFGVAWSPCGKYFAVTLSTSPYMAVFKFDPIASSITLVASYGSEAYTRIGWSPNGKYLASTVQSNGLLRVLEFNGSSLVSVATSSYYLSNALMYGFAWAPNGRYIAIGGGGDVGGVRKLVVFKFDPSLPSGSILTPFSEYPNSENSGLIVACDWSPNSKYIVFVGTAISDNNVWVLPLSAGTMTSVKYFPFGGLIRASAVSISPTGKYLYIGNEAGGEAIYNFMDAPANCLIQDNKVCNSTSWNTGFSAQGIGICGSGENLYLRNVGFKNDVNFNRAVYNVYGSSLLVADPKEFDNLWQPAYENAYGIN